VNGSSRPSLRQGSAYQNETAVILHIKLPSRTVERGMPQRLTILEGERGGTKQNAHPDEARSIERQVISWTGTSAMAARSSSPSPFACGSSLVLAATPPPTSPPPTQLRTTTLPTPSP